MLVTYRAVPNRPTPPGFQGYDPRPELSVYYRHLPHWRQKGCSDFVTFRLADSLPQSKLRQLRILRRELIEKCFAGRDPNTDSVSLRRDQRAWEQVSRKSMAATERYLDQGMGSCVLRDPKLRQIVIDSMADFDRLECEVPAWVVMPNHIHLLMRPFDEETYLLEKALQNHKKWTASRINAAMGRSGNLWQQESFDRIIRDREHLWKALQYVGNNPHKAGLTKCESARWIEPDWVDRDWGFLD